MRINIILSALALSMVICGMSARAQQPTAIGAIQGSLGDGVAAIDFESPLKDQMVTVRGVVTGLSFSTTRKGGELHGLFLQNTTQDADKDPNSSDGIYVHLGKYGDIRSKLKGHENYKPQVGDEIAIAGRVSEFHKQTQIDQPMLQAVVRKGVKLDQEVPATELDPPVEKAQAATYWERLEGMRVRVPAGALAQGGRHEMPRANDWLLWVARADRAPQDGKSPYTHRIFRDVHPLDNKADQGFDDGNGYRIILSSLGLRGATGDVKAMLPNARTFDALAEPAVGVVAYSFDQYVVLPAALKLTPGADPAANEPPQATERATEFSVASFNVENLYDLRDNPFSLTDAATDPGTSKTKPPFNYVPADEATYQEHVKALARQVIDNLKTPDIILCQELENQDIAKVESGKLVVTTQNHADGKPDTAQEICLAIKAAGGPDYDCAFDPVAGDDRGIVTAFLYRTDRVALAKPDAAPALGAGLKVDYAGTPAKLEGSLPRNPRALNAQLPANVAAEDQEAEGALVFTRAPQMAAFDVYREAVGKGEAQRVYAVNNHLSSIPNKRVTQRTEQARLLASIMTAISKTGEKVLALAAGDFNVYPRPDDPFSDKPSDQLAALYAAGLYNVYDTLLKEVPASAYSYVYEGEAQTLDQMYLTPALKAKLVQPRVAHINADFSEGEQELGVAGARRASDHDPLVVRFKF